jgi:hypothetical protein
MNSQSVNQSVHHSTSWTVLSARLKAATKLIALFSPSLWAEKERQKIEQLSNGQSRYCWKVAEDVRTQVHLLLGLLVSAPLLLSVLQLQFVKPVLTELRQMCLSAYPVANYNSTAYIAR